MILFSIRDCLATITQCYLLLGKLSLCHHFDACLHVLVAHRYNQLPLRKSVETCFEPTEMDTQGRQVQIAILQAFSMSSCTITFSGQAHSEIQVISLMQASGERQSPRLLPCQ